MPKTLTWGKSIDAVELTVNANNRPLASPRRWEIRTKAGGEKIGSVNWHPTRREYVFWPQLGTILPIPHTVLLDLGAFCKNHTDHMKVEKRKAAG